MATRGTTAAGQWQFLAPAGYTLAKVTLVLGLTEGCFMEHVMMRNKLALTYINCTVTMTRYDLTIKGATGLFTTIHAECEEVVNITYWLVVWPTSAEQRRRWRAKERLGKSDPGNPVDTLCFAAKLLDGLDEVMVFPMKDCGNDTKVNLTKAVKITVRARLILSEAQL